MPVSSGTRLGPYEVLTPLGAGGMGEVWRAKDTRLDRSVAIKVLPGAFAQNVQLRARFDREARAISSLNHPNICTLYDVGTDEGTHYLVMELIEGESLAERLQRGPLPMEQVLRIGAQIADALARAHRQGVVHRDLKPGNVMLTKSGAKLLDFGLARTSAESSAIRGLTEMPTQARPLTEEGMILGTFQYMAPEQLEGLEADARTDIFALGALLYEMATAKRAFQGESRTSLIVAIVSSQPPPISALTPMTPPALEHVVRRCLEKSPDDRWQSAQDIAGELRWISETAPQPVAAGMARRGGRERVAWTLAAMAMLVAIVTTVLLMRRPDGPASQVESMMALPAGYGITNSVGLSLSPDGRWAVLGLSETRGGRRGLWLRPLAADTFRLLAHTEGAIRPFWSPDSRKIAFFASGKLKVFDVETSSVRVLCDAPAPGGGAWSADGTIVFAPDVDGALFRVPALGGTPEALTRLRDGHRSHSAPVFVSDRTFLFTARSGTEQQNEICQSSLDDPGKVVTVRGATNLLTWAKPGILLCARDGGLVGQRYDAARATVLGEPTVLAETATQITASADGKLLMQRNPNLVLSQLLWVSRTGAEIRTFGEPALFFSPSIADDQTRFAVDLSSGARGTGDLWIYEIARGSSTRLTYDINNDSSPHWMRGDGTIVYFSAGPSGGGDIYTVTTGGTGKPELLVSDLREKRPTSVSPDGSFILYNALSGANMDIALWSQKERKATAWLATPFQEQNARFSADGKWIAYQSDETGRWEIYVRSFPDGDRKWMVSSGGGVTPKWRGDGRELFYISTDDKMMAVSITTEPQFEAGTPAVLFDANARRHSAAQYDVTRDGQHFLLNRQMATTGSAPLTLLENWHLRVK